MKLENRRRETHNLREQTHHVSRECKKIANLWKLPNKREKKKTSPVSIDSIFAIFSENRILFSLYIRKEKWIQERSGEAADSLATRKARRINRANILDRSSSWRSQRLESNNSFWNKTGRELHARDTTTNRRVSGVPIMNEQRRYVRNRLAPRERVEIGRDIYRLCPVKELCWYYAAQFCLSDCYRGFNTRRRPVQHICSATEHVCAPLHSIMPRLFLHCAPPLRTHIHI